MATRGPQAQIEVTLPRWLRGTTCRGAGAHAALEPALHVGAAGSKSAVVLPPPRAAQHPGASARARASQPFGGRAVDVDASEVTNVFVSRKRQASKVGVERAEEGNGHPTPDPPVPGPSRPLDIEHHPQRAPSQ